MTVQIGLSLSWQISPQLPAAHAGALLRLLEEVGRSGSLKKAAQALGVSYRFAWGLLREAATACGAPLVEFKRGRGARPTALGEKLLWADGLIHARLDSRLGSLRREIEAELFKVLPQKVPRLAIHASHDLALAELAALCRPWLELEVVFRGSEDCLSALASGKCNLAGFHVADALPRAAAAAAALGRWLDPRNYTLVHFVTREQGIIARPGLRIRNLHDLTRPGVRFIHRQGGLRGERPEEAPSVAAAVSEGRADAGFGLRADAMRFGLDFVPLALERYYFALRRASFASPAIQTLLQVLRGREFARMAARLPGYDASRAGVRERLDAALDWVEAPRRSAR
ncbi:MAG TPA: substrate-binding domain-containing protein [Burkholderiales bacterium]|nr:substrate-binding domain-containing protein [Burkholderiales bacterium]